MKSRFSRFVLVSTLIHLLLLMLFSFQKLEKVPIQPITVDISLSGSRSSVSTSSSSGTSSPSQNNQSRSKSFNNSPKKSPSSTSATVKKQSSKKTVSSKVNKTPTLLRNTSPTVHRSFRDIPSDNTEIQSFNRQITLDKSKELIRSTTRAAQDPDRGDGQVGGKAEDNGFDADSVFEKSSSISGKGVKGLNLETDKGTRGGSAGGGGRSSAAGGNQGNSKANGGFDWKNSEARSLVSKSDLVFPEQLEGKGIDEEVRVGFNVAPDGKVYEIELIRSSGYAELDNAVKDQVRSFRFNAVSTKKVNKAEYSYFFKLKKK